MQARCRGNEEGTDLLGRISGMVGPPADGFRKIMDQDADEIIARNVRRVLRHRGKQFGQLLPEKAHEDRIAPAGENAGQILKVLLEMIQNGSRVKKTDTLLR